MCLNCLSGKFINLVETQSPAHFFIKLVIKDITVLALNICCLVVNYYLINPCSIPSIFLLFNNYFLVLKNFSCVKKSVQIFASYSRKNIHVFPTLWTVTTQNVFIAFRRSRYDLFWCLSAGKKKKQRNGIAPIHKNQVGK